MSLYTPEDDDKQEPDSEFGIWISRGLTTVFAVGLALLVIVIVARLVRWIWWGQ